MRRRTGSLIAVLALAGLVVLAGCAKRQTVKQEEGPVAGAAVAGAPAPAAPPAPAPEAPAPAAPGARVGEGTLGEREARREAGAPGGVTPAPEAPRPAAPEVAAIQLKDINFDFDKYLLTEKAKGILQENAKVLTSDRALKILIEGHADERGTNEYNLALGEKRAQAARDHLVALGVEASQISIVSYGEERPLDPRHNEEAWAKNRRDHFVIVSK